jgi:hypothetical protein
MRHGHQLPMVVLLAQMVQQEPQERLEQTELQDRQGQQALLD